MTICKNDQSSPYRYPCKQSGISRVAQALSILILLSMMMVLLSACGGNPQAQQQASQSKTAFDRTFQQATTVGIPATQLNSILQQKQALENSQAPLTLFND